MRGLHSSESEGIRVGLQWCEADGRVFLAVSDPTTGEAFSVEVPAGERPRQVFHHPYASAA